MNSFESAGKTFLCTVIKLNIIDYGSWYPIDFHESRYLWNCDVTQTNLRNVFRSNITSRMPSVDRRLFHTFEMSQQEKQTFENGDGEVGIKSRRSMFANIWYLVTLVFQTITISTHFSSLNAASKDGKAHGSVDDFLAPYRVFLLLWWLRRK